MSATADHAEGQRTGADKLGIKPGMIVQELGHDTDVDEELRAAVVERSGAELVDEDSLEVVDVVLLLVARGRRRPRRRARRRPDAAGRRRRRVAAHAQGRP